jgi:hypothetical protein
LSNEEKTGRIRVAVNGQSYSADWEVSGQHVLVRSSLGEGSALLGGLTSAPATVATEKLREMAKAASRPPKAPFSDRSRFNVKDAFRRH